MKVSSISREPFKVLNENSISPARIRNKSNAKSERNIISKPTEDEKNHVIQFSSQKFEHANTNKSLAMPFAFAQALIVVQNRRIESLQKKIAFDKIINFAKSIERSANRNSRSAEKIIITPKKRRLLHQDIEGEINIPESSEKKTTKRDISPLNFERLKVSENYIAASSESSPSLVRKHDQNRRIDYEVTFIKLLIRSNFLVTVICFYNHLKSDKDDEETRRNTWRNGQHFSSYNAARRSPPPASIPIDFSAADTPDRIASHQQRRTESIPMNNSLRRGITEIYSVQEKDPHFTTTHKAPPHPHLHLHPPLPLHPSIKNQTRQTQLPPKPLSAPSQHHYSHPHLPQSSSASQHTRANTDDYVQREYDHMQNPTASAPAKPASSIPTSWSQSQAFYSTSSADSGAIPALRHDEFRAVVSQATTHSMKTLLKDTLLRETTVIQRSLKQYHTSVCKERVAASVQSSKNPTPIISREADTATTSHRPTATMPLHSPQDPHIPSSTTTASSSTANVSAFETAIQNFHSVDSRLLPLSALGQQSQLPLYELSTLQEKMQAWRGKYSSPMK